MNNMNWKRWKFGLFVAILTGLFTGLTGIAVGITWRQALAIILVCIAKDGLLFLQQHPADSVEIGDAQQPQQPQDTMKKIVSLLIVAVGLALAATGCVSQKKFTKQKDPFKAAVVQTDNGTVVYPSGYYSVTNGTGQVTTFPIYSAIVNTNPAPFSLKRFLWGGDHSLTAFSDCPFETHYGSGTALLVDSQYSQLTSDFTSGSRFGGNSQLSVGAINLTVSTNGINATGNAGNQLIQAIGASAGNIISNAKK